MAHADEDDEGEVLGGGGDGCGCGGGGGGGDDDGDGRESGLEGRAGTGAEVEEPFMAGEAGTTDGAAGGRQGCGGNSNAGTVSRTVRYETRSGVGCGWMWMWIRGLEGGGGGHGAMVEGREWAMGKDELMGVLSNGCILFCRVVIREGVRL